MIHDRYYFTQLSASEKAFYKNVYAGLQHFDKDIPAQTAKSASLKRVWNALHLDNPELFFVDFSTFQTHGNLFGTYLTPTYLLSAAQTAQWQQRVNSAAQRLTAGITQGADTEKELALHDRLAGQITYDHVAAANVSQNDVFSHTMLGALCRGTAVCDGIAKAVKWLLNAVNIKCIVVCGESDMEQPDTSGRDQGHAWNIVKIDNVPYHFDMTWDINLSEKGHIRYDYFNLSDVDIKKDHRWQDKLPLCTVSGQDYYTLRHLTVRSKSDLHRLLAACVRARSDSVSFRVANGLWSDVNALADDAMKVLAREKGSSIKMNYSENRAQSVVWLRWKTGFKMIL